MIVCLGVAVAAVGTWYIQHARPKMGALIDTIAIDNDSHFEIHDELAGRSFIELVTKGELKWRALIPKYAGEKGRSGVAWNDTAVTVRVDRDGKQAEVFALSLHDSSKLGGFRLAPEHPNTPTEKTGPITVTDHIRSYELIGEHEKWHELTAVDLKSGKALWSVQLGHWDVTDAGVAPPLYVWVVQANQKRWYNVLNGNENRSLN
ncbi:MAG TPA: hypothetical protein VGC41_15155 [Kofleriaceae bacterium]